MASPDLAPQVVNSFYEVSTVFLGKGLVAGIKSSFTSGRIQRGDFDMNRSRNLLKQHLPLLPREDQVFVLEQFEVGKATRAKLERDNISRFQKFMLAMEYEKVAEYTFKIIETASNRIIDNGFMAQISNAVGQEAGPQPPPMVLQPPPTGPQLPPTGSQPPPTGPQLPPTGPLPLSVGPSTTYRNPFTESPLLSTLSNVNVNDLELVRMEAYRSRVTGDAAILFDLHARDSSTQQHFATFSPQALMGNESHDDRDLASLRSHDIYGPPSEASDDADQ